ncbi:anti-sigma F factor antagonist [Paenibacillus swuensis]|uniref:Anti-sigma factor antagonist n=1 Tax=Paenibacillus swuensis TaxID=1178515 RepID=A0A172TM46_9BACL|nr:STAS domain-containing protein [Paenibacillus swuensis]ANE48108.1 anti-sigma F factor antagonist [Paenibacillus swuensis]
MNQMDKFKVTTENKETECVVYISGELDLSMAGEMRSAVEPLIEQTERTLILNLKELSYIDSTGIGIILSILKARTANEGPFLVEEIPVKIKRLFDMTGVSKFIPTNGQFA